MDINEETSKKIQELQILEQHLQSFQMEKQALQSEKQEISNAILELQKTKDEVYKVLSGIMIKSDSGVLQKDLEDREKILNLRISAIEKQEKMVESKTKTLREEINSSMQRGKS
ncbi:MAG: prefoldin subunit [Candidatus Staskawiczbacteria bacterium]|nr:prefoldin subunit [Candidatus Staskawiczbacteria bacterium]